MANKILNTAKRAKKDEFYTLLEDITNELKHYTEHFRGKTVLCNCDDPKVSNFFKYFALNFEFLGLKKLITTCYKNQDPTLFSNGKSEKAVYLVYEGDKNGNRIPDPDEIARHPLKGDGDFRSAECIELLKEADIVVTNPPFSLFREYVAQLMEYQKKFLIIGNVNAITYKEIFPLIMTNKIWLGASIHSGDRKFYVPDVYELFAAGCGVDETGKKFIRVKGVRWFTNLDYKERHEDLILYKKYTPEAYPKYDNFDAINIDKTADIPYDYDGVMGVPITFLDKYNPDQFEIVAFRKGNDGKDLVFSFGPVRERERERERKTYTVLQNSRPENSGIRQRTVNEPTLTENENLPEYSSATSIPGMIKNAEGRIKDKITYARITIRRIK